MCISELLQKAKTILAVEDSDASNKIFTQTGLITELIGNINEVLNLFFYLEPDFKDRIENIYTYAKYQGRPMFPNCQDRFPSFYQSLNQINHEKTSLVELRNQLMRIQTALRQKAALLLPSTDKDLSIDRKQFLDHQAVRVWQIGEKILHNALKQLFDDRKRRNTFIPEIFVSIFNSTAKDLAFSKFNYFFQNCLLGNIEDFDRQFVSAIWSKYVGGQDVADFMLQVIARIPEETFKKIKNPDTQLDKTLEILDEFFSSEMRNKPTMISLKHWLEKP